MLKMKNHFSLSIQFHFHFKTHWIRTNKFNYGKTMKLSTSWKAHPHSVRAQCFCRPYTLGTKVSQMFLEGCSVHKHLQVFLLLLSYTSHTQCGNPLCHERILLLPKAGCKNGYWGKRCGIWTGSLHAALRIHGSKTKNLQGNEKQMLSSC